MLLVRESGATLLSLRSKGPARPNRVITLNVDQRAGIGLPAAFLAKVQVRGAADALRAVSAQLAKAKVLARSGDGMVALGAVSQAIDLKPGAAPLLNQRCWIKGTLRVELESARQDCTRAVELADTGGAELDSRAMIFFRLHKLDQALADLNAALHRNPAPSGSLYLRAVVEQRLGKTGEADKDATVVWLISPRIHDEYGRWKIRA